MNINFQGLIPQDFNNNSRVWVYQSSRAFTVNEALEIEKLLQSFVAQWNSHGDSVKGYANLFFGQFIIFMADETATGVSGCSTDSSMRSLIQLAGRVQRHRRRPPQTPRQRAPSRSSRADRSFCKRGGQSPSACLCRLSLPQ